MVPCNIGVYNDYYYYYYYYYYETQTESNVELDNQMLQFLRLDLNLKIKKLLENQDFKLRTLFKYLTYVKL